MFDAPQIYPPTVRSKSPKWCGNSSIWAGLPPTIAGVSWTRWRWLKGVRRCDLLKNLVFTTLHCEASNTANTTSKATATFMMNTLSTQLKITKLSGFYSGKMANGRLSGSWREHDVVLSRTTENISPKTCIAQIRDIFISYLATASYAIYTPVLSLINSLILGSSTRT